MAGLITKAIVTAAAFAYGVFTVILYGLIALANGTYFTRRTEKESLELQLGKYFDSISSNFLSTILPVSMSNNESILTSGDL